MMNSAICVVILLMHTVIIMISKGDMVSSAKSLEYNTQQFEEKVTVQPQFVMFYAPWCGHCKQLSPVWDELASMYHARASEKSVTIAKVDCTTETELCAKYKVLGYPTLKLFTHKSGEVQVQERYHGERSATAFDLYLQKHLGIVKFEEQKVLKEDESEKTAEDVVVELTSASVESFHDSESSHFVMFYAPWCGHCTRFAPVWRLVAKSFSKDSRVQFGKLDCTEHTDLCKQFEVRGYPTLTWFPSQGVPQRYTGSRDADEVMSFVRRQLSQAETGEAKVDDLLDPVVVLTAENFEAQILQGITFVKFFAPWCGHCRRMAPAWSDLARKYLGDAGVTIAQVDCTVHGEVCKQHNVNGYPTLTLFHDGSAVATHTGARDLQTMYEFVEEHTSHADKTEL